MSELSRKDLRAVLEVVRLVNENLGEVELPQQALAQLGGLVGCELTSYSCLEPASGRRLSTRDEPHGADPSRHPGFDAVIGQHPVLVAYQGEKVQLGRAVTLGDVADVRTLRRLPVHVDFHEPYGIKDQLVCAVRHSRQELAVLVFSRGRRGFSPRDRAVVDAAAPHLSQAVTGRRRLVALTAAVRKIARHHDQIDQAVSRLAVLTTREREVVEQLVGGLTDREIGRNLSISPRTVHKHLESIYRKLGLGNRTSLITMIQHTRQMPTTTTFNWSPDR